MSFQPVSSVSLEFNLDRNENELDQANWLGRKIKYYSESTYKCLKEFIKIIYNFIIQFFLTNAQEHTQTNL